MAQVVLTVDRQLGLLAVAHVGDVGGNAAVQASIVLANIRHLQDAVWKQRVPAQTNKPSLVVSMIS